jgi:signal transduction histidine kinase
VETRTGDGRLRELFEASVALASELSLEALLQKLVETAVRLTDARYGALGVIDEAGHGLERFITTGVDAPTAAAIGEPPHGRGILGVLISESTPLRLPDLGDDARSVGFPENHPPMRTFLGVPVKLRGVAFGNLYLTEKSEGREFSAEDEEIVTMLAAQAAVAIENARLYESATRWSRQLETLHEVVRSIVDETEVERLLELVCERIRELTGARIAFAAVVSGENTLRIAAVSADESLEEQLLGRELRRDGTKVGRVLERRQTVRVDSVIDDPDVAQDEARAMGARTGLYVPMVARDRALGVIAIHDKLGRDPRFTDADQRVVEIFTARASVAVAMSERVARETVRRVVEAQESERRRLALELHDETGQALTSILLGLKAIRAAPTSDQAERAESDLRELVVQALQDVRALAVELRPAALDDFGLGPALERLAHTFGEQTGIETSIESRLDERPPPEIETTLYRVVQEALTNVVKHAGAEHVSIIVARRDGHVVATIDDDGRGFDDQDVRDDALGLLGMRERLTLVGGSLTVESTPGSGTTISAQAPVPAH